MQSSIVPRVAPIRPISLLRLPLLRLLDSRLSPTKIIPTKIIPTKIIPTKIIPTKIPRKFPVGLGVPPLKSKILL